MHIVQNDANLWSKNALASEFGIDRRTVDRLLKDVKPSGKRSGHPVWTLRDAVIQIGKYLEKGYDFSGDDFDPTRLPPKERKDWYDSEKGRLTYEREMGLLIPADEVAAVEAAKNKRVALTLDTLADVLERDVGLNAEQVERMNQILDAERQKLFESIIDIELNAAADG